MNDIPPVLQSFINTFPKIRPTAIKDLWDTNTTSDVTPFGHELAQNLHLWASKEEIINIHEVHGDRYEQKRHCTRHDVGR